MMVSRPNHAAGDTPYVLPAHIPRPPARPPKPREPSPVPLPVKAPKKRSPPDDDDDAGLEGPATKRTRVNLNGDSSIPKVTKERDDVLLISDDEDDDIIML